MKKYDFVIGIDPGVNTGVAVYCRPEKMLKVVQTATLLEAQKFVGAFDSQKQFLVRMEDARKRKWFGDKGREVLQGAGSIKRDCQLWEEFLQTNGIPYELVAPKNNKTNTTAEYFGKITGWTGRTSEHARAAAMLCFGF